MYLACRVSHVDTIQPQSITNPKKLERKSSSYKQLWFSLSDRFLFHAKNHPHTKNILLRRNHCSGFVTWVISCVCLQMQPVLTDPAARQVPAAPVLFRNRRMWELAHSAAFASKCVIKSKSSCDNKVMKIQQILQFFWISKNKAYHLTWELPGVCVSVFWFVVIGIPQICTWITE